MFLELIVPRFSSHQGFRIYFRPSEHRPDHKRPSTGLTESVYTRGTNNEKTALTMAISACCWPVVLQASTVYNQDGTKFRYRWSCSRHVLRQRQRRRRSGDQSYLRLNIAGETIINNETVANGFVQYNVPTNSSDNELRYAYVGIKNDRFGAFSYGRQGRPDCQRRSTTTPTSCRSGAVMAWQGTEVFGGRTNGLAQYIPTFDGLVLGAQFTGEEQAQNESDSSWTRGSEEGYALSANQLRHGHQPGSGL